MDGPPKPFLHGMHVAVPPSEYVFSSQSAHASSRNVPPGLIPYSPAGQKPSHAACPDAFAHFPRSQSRHAASGLFRGAYEPGAHGIASVAPGQKKPPILELASEHGLQTAAPLDENVPGGHGKAVAFVELSGQR